MALEIEQDNELWTLTSTHQLWVDLLSPLSFYTLSPSRWKHWVTKGQQTTPVQGAAVVPDKRATVQVNNWAPSITGL